MTVGYKIILFIHKVIRFIREIVLGRSFYYQVLENYSRHLENGEYYLFCDVVRYVWKKSNKSEWMKTIRRYPIKSFIKIIVLKNHAVVEPPAERTDGDELIITRRHNIAKIIDHKKQLITSFYFRQEELDTVQFFQDKFVCYFGSSTIQAINREQKKVVETLIQEKKDWKADAELREKCIDWFMGGLRRYCSCAPIAYHVKAKDIIKSLNSDSFFTETENNSMKEVLESISNGIQTFEGRELPFIHAHCDLVFFNILYDGETFYLIDCEYFHPNLFCFDALYWLSYEAMIHRDYSYLDQYLAGDYDKWLEPIFSEFGWQFQSTERKAYIYLLLLAELSMHLSYSEMGIVRNFEDFKKVIQYLRDTDFVIQADI